MDKGLPLERRGWLSTPPFGSPNPQQHHTTIATSPHTGTCSTQDQDAAGLQARAQLSAQPPHTHHGTRRCAFKPEFSTWQTLSERTRWPSCGKRPSSTGTWTPGMADCAWLTVHRVLHLDVGGSGGSNPAGEAGAPGVCPSPQSPVVAARFRLFWFRMVCGRTPRVPHRSPCGFCRVKAKRDDIADIKKKFAKSEDDLKALQVPKLEGGWRGRGGGGTGRWLLWLLLVHAGGAGPPVLGMEGQLRPRPVSCWIFFQSSRALMLTGGCWGRVTIPELRPNHWGGVEAAGRRAVHRQDLQRAPLGSGLPPKGTSRLAPMQLASIPCAGLSTVAARRWA